MVDVDEAPDAIGFARRKTVGITLVVNLLPHAVDPPPTQCFIERVRIRDCRFLAVLAVKTNVQFGLAFPVGSKPSTQFANGFEETNFQFKCSCLPAYLQ